MASHLIFMTLAILTVEHPKYTDSFYSMWQWQWQCLYE